MTVGLIFAQGAARIMAPCTSGQCTYQIIKPPLGTMIMQAPTVEAEKALLLSFQTLQDNDVPCVLVEVDR